jgi:hypothetical protein
LLGAISVIHFTGNCSVERGVIARTADAPFREIILLSVGSLVLQLPMNPRLRRLSLSRRLANSVPGKDGTLGWLSVVNPRFACN